MSADTSAPAAGSGRWTVAADGLRLHYRAWEIEEGRASVFIVHGLGEHSGRYALLARELNGAGYSVFALDLRGHGLSEGRRGHVWRFRELLSDVASVLDALGGVEPRFILGHSLGGLVTLRFLQTVPATAVTGAILSSPALALAPGSPLWKRAAASLLSPVLPALPLANGIEARHLSHDRTVMSAYERDPLVHEQVTPRFYTECVGAMTRGRREADRVRVPVLILVPGDDRVVATEPTRELARSIGTPVELREYAGFYHESLNEIGRERVVGDLLAWLGEQAPTAPGRM